MITNNGNNGNGKYINNGNSTSSKPSLVSPTSSNFKEDSLPALRQKDTPPLSPASATPQAKPPRREPTRIPKFDQPVILKQSRVWSRAILWGLMSVTAGSIVWANVTKIEEAVSATGKLEPTGTVKEVQAPINGVVKEIYVKDGIHVQPGTKLLTLDPTTAKAQLASLQKIRTSLVKENQFYQLFIRSETTVANPSLDIPTLMLTLTKSRAALVADNQVYRALAEGEHNSSKLSGFLLERYSSITAELNTRKEAAQLEVEQLRSQLNQTSIRIAQAKDKIALNQDVLDNVTPLMEAGAISKLQYLKQSEEVNTAQSEKEQLEQEILRLRAAIAQAQAKVDSTVALTRKEWLNVIADNSKKIAEIDSQLTKAIVENNKKIAEIDSQISQVMVNLSYQEVKAPSGGTVFELKANTPGFVVREGESILKVVPDEALVARVYITNKDIGFVKEGMKVDVRIDSFPFSEFGDVKGEIEWIGEDALPPDQIYPFYRFPAKVRLERQDLLVSGRKVLLQSGMSVNANIKLRSRTVMSIFTDMFVQSVESLKFVR